MNITLYRYKIKGALWDNAIINDTDLDKAVVDMTALPLQGEDEERKYGITFCGTEDDILFGNFVQEFPKKLTHYDSQTKEESTVDEIDSGSYLFIIFPREYIVYLQAKRSSDLPSNEEILKRFVATVRLANHNNKLLFSDLVPTEDYVDRDKIVDIFYNVSEAVTELELEDFDVELIKKQREERGKRQTYFNPIEEYQEAAEEAAVRFATHSEKASLKAKQGESFKKDPIARAMLEGASKPTKIVYRKDSETVTQYGVTRSKEIITVPSDFDADKDIKEIIQYLQGERRSGGSIKEAAKESDDHNQISLI